jgi:RNA polymerase-binding transcription factor
MNQQMCHTHLPASVAEKPYMNADQLKLFSDRLVVLKEKTLNHIHVARKNLSRRAELKDEADLAQYEEESRMALRIVDRETRLLRKVDTALERIHSGDYGYCLASGEPIGIPRLLIRPTAEYCTEVKNQLELREKHYGKRR